MAIYEVETDQGVYEVEVEEGGETTQPSMGFVDRLKMGASLLPQTPWSAVNEATFGAAGEKVAELGGEMGYPTAGAAAGTAVQMAPDLFASGAVYGGFRTSQNPFVKALREKPRVIGKQMEAGEEAAGIMTKHLPEQRGAFAKFHGSTGNVPYAAPKSYPKDTKSLVNFARERMTKYGDKLTPQEVKDYRTLLDDAIGELESKGLAGKPTHAVASDTRTMANKLYNKVIEGRESLNKAYGYSKVIHPDWQKILMNQLSRLKRKYL